MFDDFLIAIAARLRLKRFLWPSASDPRFIEKIARKQRRRHTTPPARLVRGLAIDSRRINGYDCIRIAPKQVTDPEVIMYIHGGAFVLPINNLHWRMAVDLARKTGQVIIVPLYPFVPDSNYEGIHAHIVRVYESIIEMTNSANVSVVGDSAGGNLALTLAQLVAIDDQPRTVIALSPVVDLHASNPALDKRESYDPLLPLDAIRHLLPAYYTGTSPADPLVSPLYADFTKISSNLYILNSGKDLLSPDIELFHQELLRQNVKHRYLYEKQMLHAWPIFPLRASRRSRDQIARWCAAHVLEE